MFLAVLKNITFILSDPLEQFDPTGAEKAFSPFFSFTIFNETSDQVSANLVVMLFIVLLLSTFTFYQYSTIVIDSFNFFKDAIATLLNSIFKNNTIDTIKYGVVITTVFTVILLTNFLSLLIPTGETMTSHLIINFTMSFVGILTMALRYIHKSKLNFFSLFILPGVPLLILPFITLIETISYLARFVSLSVRLFANITAGHVLVSLFGFVLLKLLHSLSLLSFLVIPFFVAILTLEFLVAFLQTYVFTVLLASYLDELEHHIE
jgi:F-type H+-transporting ATPase subunit a